MRGGSKNGSGKPKASPPPLREDDSDESISELRNQHRLELESLTLMNRPFKTLQLFAVAAFLYLRRSFVYILKKRGLFTALSALVFAFGLLFLMLDGTSDKYFQELRHYFRFGLWWIALGVASSIGLGSGLHTFVLYLGPHIALFTIKAVQCGRVDLKIAPYDTIQLKRGPSWLDKSCSDFGPPLFQPETNSLVRVPLWSILPQVQLEAILWGIGTALGELPPYFISRAARISGSKLDAMEQFDPASEEDNFISAHLKKTKRWLLSHSQHLNFFTILILASVPNPLFDLAGIMCGQFGIPFWKFFLATLVGKAIIKTHIQTVFIILLCNNELLELVENELIWILEHIPGFSSVWPSVIPKLHRVKEKYLLPSQPDLSNIKDKRWSLSFNLIWNTVLWLMLFNFFIKIVTAAAQNQLRKLQEQELTNRVSASQSSKAKHVRARRGSKSK